MAAGFPADEALPDVERLGHEAALTTPEVTVLRGDGDAETSWKFRPEKPKSARTRFRRSMINGSFAVDDVLGGAGGSCAAASSFFVAASCSSRDSTLPRKASRSSR
jgi:hypothetical protein